MEKYLHPLLAAEHKTIPSIEKSQSKKPLPILRTPLFLKVLYNVKTYSLSTFSFQAKLLIVLKGMRMEFQVRRRPSGLHIPCGVAIVCHTAANFIHASHVTSKFRFIAREVVLVSKLKLALIAGTCEELVAIKVHRTMCHLLLLLRQSQQNAGQVEVGFVFYLAGRSEVPALPFISQVS